MQEIPSWDHKIIPLSPQSRVTDLCKTLKSLHFQVFSIFDPAIYMQSLSWISYFTALSWHKNFVHLTRLNHLPNFT